MALTDSSISVLAADASPTLLAISDRAGLPVEDRQQSEVGIAVEQVDRVGKRAVDVQLRRLPFVFGEPPHGRVLSSAIDVHARRITGYW